MLRAAWLAFACNNKKQQFKYYSCSTIPISYNICYLGIRRTLTSKKKKKKKQVEEDAADGWLAWAANKQTMNQ
jgi:hypothetical protein